MTTLNMKNQHADLLFMGKTSVKPAPRGRPIVRYLVVASLAFTTVTWSITKLFDVQRVATAKAEIEERKTAQAIGGLGQRRDQLVAQLAKLEGQITAANAQIASRAATNDVFAALVEKYPSPVVQVSRDLHAAAKADEPTWLASSSTPTLDAEYERVSALLSTQATWVNDVNNVARGMRYDANVPAWFEERWGYLTPAQAAPVVAPEQVAAPEPAPVVNGGPPAAPRYVPEPEPVQATAAPVIAPPPAPVVKPVPRPPAPRTSDGRTPVTNW
jgi:cell division protein FtsB